MKRIVQMIFLGWCRFGRRSARGVDCQYNAVCSSLVAQDSIRFHTVSHGLDQPVAGKEFLGLHGFFPNAFPKVHGALKRDVINDYSL